MEFSAYGHPNIRATHRNTIEFTKDKALSIRGDCIVGVNADFDAHALRSLAKKGGKARAVISVNGLSEDITGEFNPLFEDEHEIVIRKTDFKSKRTLMIRADKVACDLDRKFVEMLKKKDEKLSIILMIL
jgi:uncharacterized protein